MTTTHRRKEVDLLANIAVDVARDDKHVLSMLALLRNGHPGSPAPTSDADYPDPTGEWAIVNDDAVQMGRAYSQHMTAAIRALQAADHIRLRMIPPDIDRTALPDPDQWCRNCLPAGYTNPRTANGGQYCGWCRTVQQSYGFAPPTHIIELHESGERGKVARELQVFAKSRKKVKK